MQNPITKQIFDHMEFLGYTMKDGSDGSGVDVLGAHSITKSNLLVRILKNTMIMISTIYALSDSDSIVTRKFLDALNSLNAQNICSKTYYKRENKKITLFIEAITTDYTKQSFAHLIDAFDKEINVCMNALEVYYSKKITKK